VATSSAAAAAAEHHRKSHIQINKCERGQEKQRATDEESGKSN